MENLSEVGDAQLVTSIARYSERALAEVYARHGGAVYGLARRVLRNDTEAEDVTQEVFLKLWNAPERFDHSRGTLRSYLLALSHARSVDLIRSQNARRARERADAGLAPRVDYSIDVEAGDSTVADQIARALASIPVEERRAIELAYFDGRTYVEVARILEQPEGTVKGRIRNGMRRLRETLTETHEREGEWR